MSKTGHAAPAEGEEAGGPPASSVPSPCASLQSAVCPALRFWGIVVLTARTARAHALGEAMGREPELRTCLVRDRGHPSASCLERLTATQADSGAFKTTCRKFPELGGKGNLVRKSEREERKGGRGRGRERKRERREETREGGRNEEEGEST